MEYRELEKFASRNDLTYDCDRLTFNIYDWDSNVIVSIDARDRFGYNIEISEAHSGIQDELLRLVFQVAQTPIEDRVNNKFFYRLNVDTRHLSESSINFLAVKLTNQTFRLTSLDRQSELFAMKFTPQQYMMWADRLGFPTYMFRAVNPETGDWA